jgi:hypothetical protein
MKPYYHIFYGGFLQEVLKLLVIASASCDHLFSINRSTNRKPGNHDKYDCQPTNLANLLSNVLQCLTSLIDKLGNEHHTAMLC